MDFSKNNLGLAYTNNINIHLVQYCIAKICYRRNSERRNAKSTFAMKSFKSEPISFTTSVSLSDRMQQREKAAELTFMKF